MNVLESSDEYDDEQVRPTKLAPFPQPPAPFSIPSTSTQNVERGREEGTLWAANDSTSSFVTQNEECGTGNSSISVKLFTTCNHFVLLYLVEYVYQNESEYYITRKLEGQLRKRT